MVYVVPFHVAVRLVQLGLNVALNVLDVGPLAKPAQPPAATLVLRIVSVILSNLEAVRILIGDWYSLFL
jgi:hypothetical protein